MTIRKSISVLINLGLGLLLPYVLMSVYVLFFMDSSYETASITRYMIGIYIALLYFVPLILINWVLMLGSSRKQIRIGLMMCMITVFFSGYFLICYQSNWL